MTQAVYKLATANHHDYYIEGEYYYFLAVDENDVDALLKDGWSLTTTEAKGVKMNCKGKMKKGKKPVKK